MAGSAPSDIERWRSDVQSKTSRLRHLKNFFRDRRWRIFYGHDKPGAKTADRDAPRAEGALIADSRPPKKYQREMAVVAALRQTVEDQIAAVGRVVSNEITERMDFAGAYEFSGRMENLFGVDTPTKASAVNDWLTNDLFVNIEQIVKETARNGREANSIGRHEEYYDQVVLDAPVLEKMLLKRGAISAANSARAIPVQDLLRTRLPGVGEVPLSEVYRSIAYHVAQMPERESAKFYADLQASARLGSEAKIIVARNHIDPQIAGSIATFVQDMHECGSDCHANPAFYSQIIDAKSVLGELLLDNGRASEADMLRRLPDAYANDRSSCSPTAREEVAASRSHDRGAVRTGR